MEKPIRCMGKRKQQEQRPWGEAKVGLVTGDEKTMWLEQNDP